MIKPCKICNKDFITQPCKVARGGGKYCSRECCNAAQNKTVALACKVCGKTFRVSPRTIKDKARGVYCSVPCFRKGYKTGKNVTCPICEGIFWMFPSKERRYCSTKCFGIANRASNNYLWKEKDVAYNTLHSWVRRRLGKAKDCKHCGLDRIPEGKKRYFQWANISKKYLRDVSDYISLCVPCHKKFDGYGLNSD